MGGTPPAASVCAYWGLEAVKKSGGRPGLTDGSVCPTLLSKDLQAGGAGAFAQCYLNRRLPSHLHKSWGGPPGLRATPPSACCGRKCLLLGEKSGSGGTRADLGVRPTSSAEFQCFGLFKWHGALSPPSRFFHGFLHQKFYSFPILGKAPKRASRPGGRIALAGGLLAAQIYGCLKLRGRADFRPHGERRIPL